MTPENKKCLNFAKKKDFDQLSGNVLVKIMLCLGRLSWKIFLLRWGANFVFATTEFFSWYQTWAKNSTRYCYSKITRKSGNIWGRTPCPGIWVFEFTHPGSAFTVRDLCLVNFFRHARILTKKGPYTNQYSCEHVGIRANLNQARNWDLCNHDFGFSISSFDST